MSDLDQPALPPLSPPPRTEPPVTEDTDERPAAAPAPFAPPPVTQPALDDPFEEWPAPQSAAVIEEEAADGASVEHVRGEVEVPDGYTVLEGTPLGNRRSVGVVVSRFNGGVTDKMLQNALDTLVDLGVAQDAITVMPVPGAFELPL